MLRHQDRRRHLVWRTNPVKSAELAQGFAVEFDHLIDRQVAYGVRGARLLGKPFEQASPILNNFATGGTCVVISRVPVRTNDDGVVLDAHFDFGIRLDVDLLENRPIEDKSRRISEPAQSLYEWHLRFPVITML